MSPIAPSQPAYGHGADQPAASLAAVRQRAALVALVATALVASALAMPAWAVQPTSPPSKATSAAPSTAPSAEAVARPAASAAQPVERLMIRYKAGGKSSGANANAMVTPAAGQGTTVTAAAQVAQSASQAQVTGLRFLRSVAPQVHVAKLERPLSAEQAGAVMQRLRSDPAVAAVEVDRRVRAHAITDPLFTNSSDRLFQWHLQSPATEPGGINAAAAWALSTGAGVVVAVLDGGYRPHRDLVGNLLTPGYDFVRADDDGSFWNANDGDGPDRDAQDPGDWIAAADARLCTIEEPGNSTWHGTHVAGLLGATANNSEGVGVAHGARVLPVRVLGRCGGFISDVLAGARWAAGLSVVGGAQALSPAAKVLNLSLGVDEACDSITQSVVDEIRTAGVSIVASSGNEGATKITAPANCKGVVAVTAHDRTGRNADYANVGAGVALSAPGGTQADPVMSTWNNGLTGPGSDVYQGLRGTSMATPLVAGTLALMAAARPDLPMSSLEAIMRGATRAFPAGDYCSGNPAECGSGLLDTGAAVAAAQAANASLPDLDLTQRMGFGTVASGQTASFTVEVTNKGAGTANAVELTATLSGAQFQTVTASQPGASVFIDGNTVRVQLASLAARQVLVVNATARVTASSGNVSSSAVVQTSDIELSDMNNSDVLVLTTRRAPVTTAAVPADSGGGCTMAPPGARGDAGLPLLLLLALMVGGWRWALRRRSDTALRRIPLDTRRAEMTGRR